MDHLDKMEILQILSMEKYIPARKLAEKSKIGEKTLRKRMKELKEELERNGASIEIKHGQGYRRNVCRNRNRRCLIPQENVFGISCFFCSAARLT